MADDIQPIETNGTGAITAARLCNFVTAQSFLLETHKAWLDANVRPKIMPLANPWVDLIGYASRLGTTISNQTLSDNRCREVKNYISRYSSKIQFPMEFGKGESESGSVESDNSGYFRAVEVWVYGSQPAVRPKIPTFKVIGSTKFKIRFVGGTGVSVGIPQGDFFFFQIVDIKDIKAQTTAFYIYAGGGLTIPTPKIPTPSFPPISSAAKKGPFVNFRTTNPVLLSTFAGQAFADQPPGITVGPASATYPLRLWFESNSLSTLKALVLPKPVLIPTGSGLGITLYSTTGGTLQMVQGPFPFTGP